MSWLVNDDTIVSESEFMLEIMETLGRKRNQYDIRLDELASFRAAGHQFPHSCEEEVAGSADAYMNTLSFMVSVLDHNTEVVALTLTEQFIQQKCADLALMYDIVNENSYVDEDEEIPTYQVFLHESYRWIETGIISAIRLLKNYESNVRP